MQLFAHDQERVVDVESARKGITYSCPECLGSLRVKESLTRRKHFFHLSSAPSCRQHQKNETHLLVQKTLLSQLPQGEGVLEKRFPLIRRIGDLVWLPKKIVFEIQCSPIALEEVQARHADYGEIGFEVIWILHDKCFNQQSLSPAECFLRGRKSCFTNIDERGEGTIYNQEETIHLSRRCFKGAPLPLLLTGSPAQFRAKSPLFKMASETSSFFRVLQAFFRLYFLYLLKRASR